MPQNPDIVPTREFQSDPRITSDAGALGYAHQDDQDILAHDVAMKLAVWDRPGRQGLNERLASQPSDWRLIERVAEIKPNLEATREALPEWVVRHQRAAGRGRKVTHGTLDIDPFPIEVHGKQLGGVYHGYNRKTSYHPRAAGFSAEGSYASSRLGEFNGAFSRRCSRPGRAWFSTLGG